MNQQTLLVPVDFSDCSHDVLHHAIEAASSRNARIVLLHVINPPDGIPHGAAIPTSSDPDASSTTAMAMLEKEAQQKLVPFLASASEQNVEASSLIEYGDPALAIVQVAQTLPADLIVIGTHARTGLARLVLGSVAKRVTRNAPCPVLTMRTQHKPTCEARSCDWCKTHVTDTQERLVVEQDG